MTLENSINKALLKIKPIRNDINTFKTNLSKLIESSQIDESEEHHKNNLSDFLKNSFFGDRFFINTKERYDLVIHNGISANSSVGIIIETKRPSNVSEMLSKSNINKKALHELILYFLRERISNNNLELKHLIATNINEWFIFDAKIFEKYFAQNKDLVKKFEEFENKNLSGNTTDFFYSNIAQPLINDIYNDLIFTYFNINDYSEPLLNKDNNDDVKLIPLFRLLSPEHLLKLNFANDSNLLDKKFYNELLHIIGLEEVKEQGKKVISRKLNGKRNDGSLIEEVISQLETMDKIRNVQDIHIYGDDYNEQLFNIALELVTTWINRILFIKLLESQLLAYNKANKEYIIINNEKIKEFDDLNTLFFQVLAVDNNERKPNIQNKFKFVPYLNSSLFEVSQIENLTLVISNLQDKIQIPILSTTVLKDEKGDKLSGEIRTFDYLLKFLDAYDFASVGGQEIQEENKSLINASVLGLIFEKINGYKDGSYFTPGFITMYMCKETIRRAVIQKFNENNWNVESLIDIHNKIGGNTEKIKEANNIINSIKICDPAVGSGHFLVSTLNELISIKKEIACLCDENYKILSNCDIVVINDELIISDQDGKLFDYNPNNSESQRIQETLFKEKQIIIENCLFGVDINPNSVKICRLRLWIELLKNAYYKKANGGAERYLETLPNIDINIKIGNSLVSRFPIDINIKDAFKKNKSWSIESYKFAVSNYRNAKSKDEKRKLTELIDSIKKDFKIEISYNDPLKKKLSKLNGELALLQTQTSMFERSKIELKEWEKNVKSVSDEIVKVETEIIDKENNQIYLNGFEWRFEFPEVLNSDGDFVGFDIVIGNPPYIQLQNNSGKLANMLSRFDYKTFARTGDIYSIFIEKGIQILAQNKFLAFITSNKWMRAGYGEATRDYLSQFTNPKVLIDLVGTKVFDEATVDTNILITQKQTNQNQCLVTGLDESFKSENNFNDYINNKLFITNSFNSKDSWTISSQLEEQIKLKIERIGTPLKDWDISIFRGVLTGYNEAFIIDGKKKDELIATDPKSAEIIKPILRGRDIKKYSSHFADLWLINSHNGLRKENIQRIKIEDYTAVKQHLDNFYDKLESRQDKGDTPYNLRNCAYLQEFEKEKIVWNRIASEKIFSLVEKDILIQDSMHFIVGEQLNFINAILNSKLIQWLINLIIGKSVGGNSGNSDNVKQLPILKISEEEQQPIIDLVEKILATKDADPKADTSDLEYEIDQLVYKLYELTEEEIKLVEE